MIFSDLINKFNALYAESGGHPTAQLTFLAQAIELIGAFGAEDEIDDDAFDSYSSYISTQEFIDNALMLPDLREHNAIIWDLNNFFFPEITRSFAENDSQEYRHLVLRVVESLYQRAQFSDINDTSLLSQQWLDFCNAQLIAYNTQFVDEGSEDDESDLDTVVSEEDTDLESGSADELYEYDADVEAAALGAFPVAGAGIAPPGFVEDNDLNLGGGVDVTLFAEAGPLEIGSIGLGKSYTI